MLAGVLLLLARWEAGGSRGLAEAPWRPWTVEVLDVGDAACEARDSTWSMEWDCQPWFTFTIAYERRALSSAES